MQMTVLPLCDVEQGIVFLNEPDRPKPHPKVQLRAGICSKMDSMCTYSIVGYVLAHAC